MVISIGGASVEDWELVLRSNGEQIFGVSCDIIWTGYLVLHFHREDASSEDSDELALPFPPFSHYFISRTAKIDWQRY
jgi:hypothetical protein